MVTAGWRRLEMNYSNTKYMLVSFIIPSYNSAHTVKRCLDSIYALSLKPEEFEVIFIDDCSTDNTVEIVEAYSRPLPKGKGVQNLVLLRQPQNNRQGAARNRGVSVAKGEYICFVDSDDAVKEGIVDAIRLAKEKQTDMTAFHTANANEDGQIIKEQKQLSYENGEIFSGVELQNQYSYWCSGPVAYIYSKEFLVRTNYPFHEGVLYEDADFVMAHLYAAKRMAYSQSLGYLAYYREGSTTHSISHKNIADFILLGVRMLRLYERIKDERIKDERIKDERLTNELVSELASEGKQKFAEDVLEGACWNMRVSTKRMIKLSSIKEVRLCYDRLDTCLNRQELCADKRLRKYYWNTWTTICLKYKNIATILLAMLIPMHKIASKIVKRQ